MEDGNAGIQTKIDVKIETGWLLAFYGPLLTDRQQELLRLSCEEDMSLAEIAQQEGVSRQGVHDILHRATQQLYQWEEKLGMLKRFRRMHAGLQEILIYLNDIQETAGQEQLAAAKQKIVELLSADEE
jgi:predicted DNA-binding protein YlxM (UPF0122 family)